MEHGKFSRPGGEHGGRIEAFVQKFDNYPELSRRHVLKGLGSLTLLTSLQGAGALVRLAQAEPEEVVHMLEGSGVCGDDIRACQDESPIELPDTWGAETPPVQHAEDFTSPVDSTQPNEEFVHTTGGCQFETLSGQECVLPERIPEHVPFKRFDTGDAHELDKIYRLLDAVELAPDRYQRVKIDTSRSESLKDVIPGYPVWPSMNVTHWVGYEDLTHDIDEYIKRMRISRLSYNFIAMANGTIHMIAPSPHTRVNHARYANHDSMGISANANSIDTLTPEALEAMIYTELWSDKEYSRTLTRENSRSHAEIERQDGVTKIDWPSQLQDGFYALKLRLNHEVYVLGKGGHPSPLTI